MNLDKKKEFSKFSFNITNTNKLTFEDEILIRQIFRDDELINQFMLDCFTLLFILETKDIHNLVEIFSQHIAPSIYKKYKNLSILELDADNVQNDPNLRDLNLSNTFIESLVATFTRTLKENLPRIDKFKEAPRKIVQTIAPLDMGIANDYVTERRRTVCALVNKFFMEEPAARLEERINSFFNPLYEQVRSSELAESPRESHNLRVYFAVVFLSLAVLDNVALRRELSVINLLEYFALTVFIMLLKFKYDAVTNQKQISERCEKIISDLSPKIVIKFRMFYGGEKNEIEPFSGSLPQSPTLSYPSTPLPSYTRPQARTQRERKDVKLKQPRPIISQQAEAFEVVIGGSTIKYNPDDLDGSTAFPVRNSNIKTFVSVSRELRDELKNSGSLTRFMKSLAQTKFASSQGDQGLKFLMFIQDNQDKKKLAIYEAKFMGLFMGNTRALGTAMNVNISDTEYQFIHLGVLCTSSHKTKKLYNDIIKLLKMIKVKKPLDLEDSGQSNQRHAFT